MKKREVGQDRQKSKKEKEEETSLLQFGMPWTLLTDAFFNNKPDNEHRKTASWLAGECVLCIFIIMT